MLNKIIDFLKTYHSYFYVIMHKAYVLNKSKILKVYTTISIQLKIY